MFHPKPKWRQFPKCHLFDLLKLRKANLQRCTCFFFGWVWSAFLFLREISHRIKGPIEFKCNVEGSSVMICKGSPLFASRHLHGCGWSFSSSVPSFRYSDLSEMLVLHLQASARKPPRTHDRLKLLPSLLLTLMSMPAWLHEARLSSTCISFLRSHRPPWSRCEFPCCQVPLLYGTLFQMPPEQLQKPKQVLTHDGQPDFPKLPRLQWKHFLLHQQCCSPKSCSHQTSLLTWKSKCHQKFWHMDLAWMTIQRCTCRCALPESQQLAFEKWWLEDDFIYFPFGKSYFKG